MQHVDTLSLWLIYWHHNLMSMSCPGVRGANGHVLVIAMEIFGGEVPPVSCMLTSPGEMHMVHQ